MYILSKLTLADLPAVCWNTAMPVETAQKHIAAALRS